MPCLVYENFLCSFYHFERKGLLAEPQVLSRDETVQEDIDACITSTVDNEQANPLTFPYRVRHSDDTVHGWFAVQTAHEIGEVVEYGQVMLHGNNIVVARQ